MTMIGDVILKLSVEKMAGEFLELASEQRLEIIMELMENNITLSNLSKKLEATTPEVHRNINRLLKKNIIQKNTDGSYSLTHYGNYLCNQIPSLFFVLENHDFFNEHGFGNIPLKYIHRIGELENAKIIKGFVRVLAKWIEIHENANEYIYNILSEVPYNKDLISSIDTKLKNGVKICSIFSETAIIPEDRKKLFEKKNFQKYVKNGLLERKMNPNIPVMILLNEKESCVIFAKKNTQPDMSQMLVSTDPQFHEWCLDFFNEYWKKSTSFQESKLKIE